MAARRTRHDHLHPHGDAGACPLPSPAAGPPAHSDKGHIGHQSRVSQRVCFCILFHGWGRVLGRVPGWFMARFARGATHPQTRQKGLATLLILALLETGFGHGLPLVWAGANKSRRRVSRFGSRRRLVQSNQFFELVLVVQVPEARNMSQKIRRAFRYVYTHTHITTPSSIYMGEYVYTYIDYI